MTSSTAVGTSARPITLTANSVNPLASERVSRLPREEGGSPTAWKTVSIVSWTMCSVVVLSEFTASLISKKDAYRLDFC